MQTWKELPRYWMLSLRSCLIGCWMGISPAGATPASFMSYGIAKRISKRGHLFGTGEIEGVVAPETAAHAAGTSALLPMISLGVPGSPTAAVLLGGLLIWGLQPGPLLFTEQKDFVWGLIASMYMGNIVGLIIVLTCVPLFASILKIPFSVIAPVIMVFCAIGAYTVHNNTFDVVMMVVFGIAGYFMKKTNYPLAPMVLAIVLGDKAEESFRQSLLASQGSLSVFWSSGLVSTIMALGLIALFWPLIQNFWCACARWPRFNARRINRNAGGAPKTHCKRPLHASAYLAYCIPVMSSRDRSSRHVSTRVRGSANRPRPSFRRSRHLRRSTRRRASSTRPMRR